VPASGIQLGEQTLGHSMIVHPLIGLKQWLLIVIWTGCVAIGYAQDLQAVRWYGGEDLIDLSSGRWLTQARYQQLTRLSNGYYLATTRKEQFLLINDRGQECTKRYERLIPIRTADGHIRALQYRKGRYWGLMSPEGRVMYSAQYDQLNVLPQASPTEALLIQTERKGLTGLMRPDGQTLVPPNRLANLQPVSHGAVIAQEAASGLWGALDTNGQEVIAFAYDALRNGGTRCTSDDSTSNIPTFIARQGQQWGVLLADQSLSQPILMDSIRQACSGFALGWIGHEPKLVAGLNAYTATAAAQLPFGRIAFSRNEREWGIYDLQRRKFTLPCQFRQIQPLYANLYQVQDADGRWGWVDTVGKVILPCRYDTIIPYHPINFFRRIQRHLFDNAWAKRVAFESDLWMEWAREGAVNSPRQPLYWVAQSGSWGLIDSTGLALVPPTQTPLTDRWKVAYAGAGMGLVGYDGLPLTRLDYQSVMPLNNRHTVLRKDNRLYLFNYDLNTTTATPYDAILATTNGYLVVRKAGKWGVLRPDESELLACVHHSIRLAGRVQLADNGSIVICDTLLKYREQPMVQFFLVNEAMESYELVVVDSVLHHFQPTTAIPLQDLLRATKDYQPIRYESPPKLAPAIAEAIMPVANGVWFLIFPDGEPQYPYPITGYYPITPHKLAIRQNGRWGIYDLKRNRLVVLPEYSAFIYPQYPKEKRWGYIGAVRDGHIAIIDTNGATWTAPSYAAMRPWPTNVQADLSIDRKAHKLLLQSARQWNLLNGSTLLQPTILADSLVLMTSKGRPLPYYITQKGKFLGVVDTQGVEVLAPEWEQLVYAEGVFIVRAGGLSAMADNTGHVLLPLEYPVIEPAGKLLIVQKQKGGMGLVNATGQVVVPLEYEDIKALRTAGRTYLRVRKQGQYGLLDSAGRTVVDCQYRWMTDSIRGGLLEVRTDAGLAGLVDVFGNVLLGPKYRLLYGGDGYWGAEFEGNWAILDSTGEWLSDFEFEAVAALHGPEITSMRDNDSSRRASKGLLYAQQNGKWGVQHRGKWACPPQFSAKPSYDGGRYWLGRAGESNQWGVWDVQRALWAVEPKQDSLYRLAPCVRCTGVNGPVALWAYRSNGLLGVWGEDGTQIAPFYDELKQIREGVFVGLKWGKYRLLDRAGNRIAPHDLEAVGE
jgi:hypothetical protein